MLCQSGCPGDIVAVKQNELNRLISRQREKNCVRVRDSSQSTKRMKLKPYRESRCLREFSSERLGLVAIAKGEAAGEYGSGEGDETFR